MTDLWNLVAAERRALADDLAHLTPEQWADQSLCSGWTVRDVVAHLTAAASTSPLAFFGQFGYPGIGYRLYQAIQAKDLFVVQGIVLMLSISIAVIA